MENSPWVCKHSGLSTTRGRTMFRDTTRDPCTLGVPLSRVPRCWDIHPSLQIKCTLQLSDGVLLHSLHDLGTWNHNNLVYSSWIRSVLPHVSSKYLLDYLPRDLEVRRLSSDPTVSLDVLVSSELLEPDADLVFTRRKVPYFRVYPHRPLLRLSISLSSNTSRSLG